MKIKKILCSVLLATCMLFSLTACGSSNGSKDAKKADDSSKSGNITVGFSQVGAESDWRTANTQNYQDVFSEENGYSLDLVDCDNDNAAQLEAVRTFISKDMDYIVIAPIQSAGWDTVLQEAQDAGIPVIIADREIEASDDLYDAWVGTNTTNEGITAGNWLAEYLGDKDANILVIEGSVGASAALGRTEGFNQVAGEHDN